MSGLTRVATADDADVVARLLIDFNREYDDPVPGREWLADRIRSLLAEGATDALVVEDANVTAGVAVLRYRPSLWADADECYLAELYVVPGRRGRGLGRMLLLAALRRATERGATYMDLTTTNRDAAAVALYESVGFDRHERGGPGVESYYFEIDLPAPAAPGAPTAPKEHP
jgi:ribosomal protein S18 acetylase RimI-like enzyme